MKISQNKYTEEMRRWVSVSEEDLAAIAVSSCPNHEPIPFIFHVGIYDGVEDKIDPYFFVDYLSNAQLTEYWLEEVDWEKIYRKSINRAAKRLYNAENRAIGNYFILLGKDALALANKLEYQPYGNGKLIVVITFVMARLCSIVQSTFLEYFYFEDQFEARRTTSFVTKQLKDYLKTFEANSDLMDELKIKLNFLRRVFEDERDGRKTFNFNYINHYMPGVKKRFYDSASDNVPKPSISSNENEIYEEAYSLLEDLHGIFGRVERLKEMMRNKKGVIGRGRPTAYGINRHLIPKLALIFDHTSGWWRKNYDISTYNLQRRLFVHKCLEKAGMDIGHSEAIDPENTDTLKKYLPEIQENIRSEIGRNLAE